MREIKFRAMNLTTKQICRVISIDFLNQDVLVIIDEDRANQEVWKFKDCRLLQFTGLRDKNKKEICEGDILIDNYKRVLEVVWHNNGFKFKSLSRTNFLYAEMNQWFEYDFSDKPEIIGNIYENGDLLNAKN